MYKYMPLAHKIMVKLDKTHKTTETVTDDKDVVKTKSGIYLPKKNEISDWEERKEDAAECGELVAVGPYAFKDIEGCPDELWAPIGSRVVFPAYAGRKWKDEEGNYYRIFEDQLLFAIETHKTEARKVNG